MNPTRKNRKHDDIAMSKLIQTVSPYEIIGLGEGSHGSYKNAVFRKNVIKQLIKEHNVREVFIEDDVFTLLKILKDKGRNLSKIMHELQWSFDNSIMRNLFEWIFEFNKKHPKDQVKILGIDIQLYQLEDKSDNSQLGVLYRKWGKYHIDHQSTKDTHSSRDKGMAEMIKAQHVKGVKAVCMAHNLHLNKSAVHSNMGFHINQAYPDKYIVIANTFTKGTYHVLFLGYSEGLKNEFQNITVNVKDPFYKGTHPIFYDSPPVNYLWSGDGTGDSRDPMKHFVRNSSNGFDAILFINNEEPLKPYKTNTVFS